ncbi:MAG: KH domain-containing protein [Cellulosilyticaceae bacterium]
MKNLVEVIAKELVDYPEQVCVSQKEDDQTVIIELKVAPEDMGKIIGKQGRIAKAIRSIVKSASATSEKKVVVEIMQ